MYKIMARYGNGAWEEIDSTDDKDAADYLLGEYTMAYGAGWTLKVKKSR